MSRALPNPGGLDSACLLEAAARDAPTAEVVQMSRLFQWLLPGLGEDQRRLAFASNSPLLPDPWRSGPCPSFVLNCPTAIPESPIDPDPGWP